MVQLRFPQLCPHLRLCNVRAKLAQENISITLPFSKKTYLLLLEHGLVVVLVLPDHTLV